MIGIFSFFLIAVFTLALNANKYHQPAALCFLAGAMATSIFIVSISSKQTAAPYANIVIGMYGLFAISNRLVKALMVGLAFLFFIVLNGFQIYYLPFEIVDYIPIIFLMVSFYLGLILYDNDYRKNEQKIKSQKQNLEERNKTIQEQSTAFADAQEKIHQREIELKQRDIEAVLTNNLMQIKLRNNIIDELEKIKRRKDTKTELSGMVTNLKREASSLEKMNLLSKQEDVANGALYFQLQEKHPDLTRSELEICAFIKIGLSSKEIAHIRSTSDNTVNVLKTRLRKKIGLESNVELRGYLLTV